MKNLSIAAFMATTLACASVGAQAQTAYVGLGAPGALTIGYAMPMGSAGPLSGQWGVRGEFAGGISLSQSVTEDGNTLSAKLRANRLGAFADWFPTDSNLRLVGGLTVNDIKMTLGAAATGDIDINGKTVSLSGERFNVTIKQPSVTPYLGIGWGHRASTEKGLGFFADAGVTFGAFKASVDTSLVGKGNPAITQADVDKEVQTLKDSLAKLSVVPSVAIGVNYRF